MGRKQTKRANYRRFPKKSKRVQKQKHTPHLLFEVVPISATTKTKITYNEEVMNTTQAKNLMKLGFVVQLEIQ